LRNQANSRQSAEEHIVNIAIIGAGNVGSGLATALVKAGHAVTVASRTADSAGQVASAAGATTATTAAGAAAAADVIVLAVPFDSAEDVAREIAPVVDGKVIVDVTNPAKPDWSGPLFEGADSGAERLAVWLPGASIVKALNTVFASNLGNPTSGGISLDGYVAGDDPVAKARVLELVASLGFNPIDVGPLTASRQLEAVAWLNISLNASNGWPWQSGWKLVGAPATALARAA
jgi:8-hydroxy-5-deazaflavin:NADPH oxidoreductase